MSELLIPGSGYFEAGGYLGHALLAAAICLAILAAVPISPLCFAGGLAFGFAAIPIVLAGATVGSVAAALLARYLLRERFAASLVHRPRLGAIVKAVEDEGWWVICLLRFSSPVPGTLLSYGVGLTRISVWRFCSANLVGMTIPVALLVALGATGRAAIQGFPVSAIQGGLLALGVIATLIAATVVTARMRVVLQQDERGAAQVTYRSKP